ncbi:hypothetical protein ABE504_24035 [Paenibacillus oryzisoli]|uniref:hypothetical protein n=1 Tax=Paenibacillus oryzisoli TaxID=1850517 RepID=UPI003D2BB1BD
MDTEENDSKPLSESNIVHINTHFLTKQIKLLLKTLNPQIKSSNLNAHFYQLIQTLITQSEFLTFDLQIKMKNICIDLEKCILNSKVSIVFFDYTEQRVTHFVAPSFTETLQNFLLQYNQSNQKMSTLLDYKIRVSNISKDSRWIPYYHHFEKLGVTSCWTIPIYRTPQIICAFAIYTSTYKNPISKELHYIDEKKHYFNELICAYPADFTSHWMKGAARTD